MMFNLTKKVILNSLSVIGTIAIISNSYAQCPAGNMSVSFDLSKTNNPSIKKENTYIVVLGINPQTKRHAYVKFNKANSNALIDVNSPQINGQQFGYPLSALTQESNGLSEACIPHITSGRIYFSFGNPLNMPTDTRTLTPIQPNVNDDNTTTEGTLFDKVEFNYSTNGETVINPTGVDFIAVPYTIKQAGVQYGHAGGLDGIIKNMKTIVCGVQGISQKLICNKQWHQSEWSSLVVYDKHNNLMRIDAPGRDGNKFDNYFSNYIEELSLYYSSATNRSIFVDLVELNQGIWRGSFIPGTKKIVFSQRDGKNSNKYIYDLGQYKTSNSILMGAQSPFNNRDSIDSTLSRDLTSAIVSGMLMRKPEAFVHKDFFDGFGNPVFKNKEQMSHLMEYYFNNVENSVDYTANQCGIYNNAPCINVYSEALHALSFDKHITHPQQSYKNSYAFAYDDFLGMDGTNTQTDAKPATIVLGDMKGRKIPHVD